MKKTKEEAEQTRVAIIKSALKIFSKMGYSGTKLTDIAKNAGVTKGAIYWNFKSKMDLFKQMIRESSKDINKELSKIIFSADSPLKKIERILKYLLKLLYLDENYRLVEEITWQKTELTSEFDDFMKEQTKNIDELKELLLYLIAKGKKKGEITKDFDDETIALSIISYLSGVEGFWLSNKSLFSLEEKCDEMVDFFLRSLQA